MGERLRSPLLDLDREAWENLCDGCGRCCLVKLEDEDSGEIHYTNVACRFLDTETCRCTDYENRSCIQPACLVLGPDNLEVLRQMPWTCAYRLVDEGRECEQDAGSLKVAGQVVSEEYIHEEELLDHIVHWVGTTG